MIPALGNADAIMQKIGWCFGDERREDQESYPFVIENTDSLVNL
jgi:hypothetical protein